jgi:SNF2 family DNA or RNA helicase
MGLGKTLQCIAFIAAILGNADANFFRPSSFAPVVVVMPASVLDQWTREFARVLFYT